MYSTTEIWTDSLKEKKAIKIFSLIRIHIFMCNALDYENVNNVKI